MRKIEELRETGNHRVYKMIRKEYTLCCSRCRPHRGSNASIHHERPSKYKKSRIGR